MSLSRFSLQDWEIDGDIVTAHTLGVLNVSDDLTKPSACQSARLTSQEWDGTLHLIHLSELPN